MLRAPVLRMRDIRNRRIGRTIRKKFGSRDEAAVRKDLKVSLRDAFYIQALSCCSRFNGTDGEESELYVTVQISEEKAGMKHGMKVFYKDDLDRFPHRYTLKLRTVSKYIVNIAADPAQELSYVKIGGCKFDEFRLINDPEAEEEEKVIFSFIWCTKKMGRTGKMYRCVLPCVLKFQGYKEIKFEVMVKFYEREDKEKHCRGKPLTSLVLNYTIDKDKQLKTKHYDIQFH